MKSPINILVTKITGTLVYRGLGSHYIEQRHSVFTVEPFEYFLDNEEGNPSTLHYLPNGNLCIYTRVGDEQPSSELMIIQDWKIEHVTRNVPLMDAEQFARLFDYAPFGKVEVSKKLEHLFNQPNDGKE
jgi:hypothetical protein